MAKKQPETETIPLARKVREDLAYSALLSRIQTLQSERSGVDREIVALVEQGAKAGGDDHEEDRRAGALALLNGEAPPDAAPNESDIRLTELLNKRDLLDQAIEIGERHTPAIYGQAVQRVREALEPEIRAAIREKVLAVVRLDVAARRLEKMQQEAGLPPGSMLGVHRLVPALSLNAGAPYEFVQSMIRAGFVSADEIAEERDR